MFFFLSQFLLCLAYACPSYYLSNQPLDLTRFSMFLGVCLLVGLTAEGLGLYLGTLDNTVVSAHFCLQVLAFEFIFNLFFFCTFRTPYSLDLYLRLTFFSIVVACASFLKCRIICTCSLTFVTIVTRTKASYSPFTATADKHFLVRTTSIIVIWSFPIKLWTKWEL